MGTFVVLGLSLTTRGKPTPLTFGKFGMIRDSLIFIEAAVLGRQY
jgi:hypothetical protein